MIYGGKDLAAAFRTVRANTITIAEDIPVEQYAFRPTPEMKSVAEQLAHVALNPMWQMDVHGNRIPQIEFERFQRGLAEAAAREQLLHTKDQIIAALKTEGEAFAAFLDSLSDDVLGERVSFPPPVQPASRTRFEMLLSAKEHEMHHRAQLMVYQRLLGMVPHLTARRQARVATVTTPAS
jgi:uncharacterized damage-inducible protein DinB